LFQRYTEITHDPPSLLWCARNILTYCTLMSHVYFIL
jgi:hypothetical protein